MNPIVALILPLHESTKLSVDRSLLILVLLNDFQSPCKTGRFIRRSFTTSFQWDGILIRSFHSQIICRIFLNRNCFSTMIMSICFFHRSISILCSRNLRISILNSLKNGSKIPRSRRTFNFWWVNNFWNDQAWVFLRRIFPQKFKESPEVSNQNGILRSLDHNLHARVIFHCSSNSSFFQLIHKPLLFNSNPVPDGMIVDTIITLQKIASITRGSS